MADVESLSRFENPRMQALLRKKSQVIWNKTVSLEEAFEKVFLEEDFQKANVTLDPNTAHPAIFLGSNCKNARWDRTEKDLPDIPARFNLMPSVLGHPIFTSGRHSWEVVLDQGKHNEWAVGVARESIRRKGWLSLSSHLGIWAVGMFDADYVSPGEILVSTSPWRRLAWDPEPRNIRVTLDYEEGRVEFFDAAKDELIYAFDGAPFTGEGIRPFFKVSAGFRLN